MLASSSTTSTVRAPLPRSSFAPLAGSADVYIGWLLVVLPPPAPRQDDAEFAPPPRARCRPRCARGARARCASRSRAPGRSLPARARGDRRCGRTSRRCAGARPRAMPAPLSLTSSTAHFFAVGVRAELHDRRRAAVLLRVREEVQERRRRSRGDRRARRARRARPRPRRRRRSRSRATGTARPRPRRSARPSRDAGRRACAPPPCAPSRAADRCAPSRSDSVIEALDALLARLRRRARARASR